MQTLSSLISEPTENDRNAFEAITGTQVRLSKSDLALIRRALSSYSGQCDRMSEQLTREADIQPRKRQMYMRMANEQCADACDANELARKLEAMSRGRK